MSLPDSSVYGILQALILEWVAISFSRGFFPTQGSNLGLLCFRQILYQLSHQGSPASEATTVLLFLEPSRMCPGDSEKWGHPCVFSSFFHFLVDFIDGPFFFRGRGGVITGLGEGNVNPLQYSCLENSIDRGVWQATVHVVTVRHDWARTHTHTHTHYWTRPY